MLLAAAYVRQERDRLLHYTTEVFDRHCQEVMQGYPPSLTEAQLDEVALYAQALRDVCLQPTFPHDIQWPALPHALKQDFV